MKNREFLFVLLLFPLFILNGCRNKEVKTARKYKLTDCVPTLEHKISKNRNAVYCATTLLVWDNIRKELASPILIPANQTEMILLNQSQSFVSALDKGEYTSFTNIKGNKIEASAEFSNSLSFGAVFNKNDSLLFNQTNVASFSSIGKNEIAQVLYYNNDSDFVLKIKPVSSQTEMIFLQTNKEYHMLAEIIKDINDKTRIGLNEMCNLNTAWKYNIDKRDKISIPKLDIEISSNLPKLKGSTITAGNITYTIDRLLQSTTFLLNEKGAKVKGKTIMRLITISLDKNVEKKIEPKYKQLEFNKPFFLMLKKKNAPNPYLALWISNTELMLKNSK